MLKLSLTSLNAIEQGAGMKYKVKIYFTVTEAYTEDDYLQSVSAISTSMSGGSYEIANTTVTLRNKDYYFSRKCVKELPNKRPVEIYGIIGAEEILLFSGIVGNWTLTATELSLGVNA